MNAKLATTHKQTKLQIALGVLKKALKGEEYRKTWQANIAMSYVDAEVIYKQRTGKTTLNQDDQIKIANEAAENFISMLCA